MSGKERRGEDKRGEEEEVTGVKMRLEREVEEEEEEKGEGRGGRLEVSEAKLLYCVTIGGGVRG